MGNATIQSCHNTVKTSPDPVHLKLKDVTTAGEWHYKWIPSAEDKRLYPKAAQHTRYEVYIKPGETTLWRLDDSFGMFTDMSLFVKHRINPNLELLRDCEEGYCTTITMIDEGVQLFLGKLNSADDFTDSSQILPDSKTPPAYVSLYFFDPVCRYAYSTPDE